LALGDYIARLETGLTRKTIDNYDIYLLNEK
jgi:hypothetical protein